ncbi:MAG: hypothetical protein SCALA702_35270 [Melioribacteraceae bacterium]|nr:MAG: hypothetical protein SCALA702_35270 [Melioribacteraceae bacterium]
MPKNYSLHTQDNEIIDVTVHFTDLTDFGKIIVFVHGFKGFKDWGFGPYLAEYFSKQGFFVLTFNFSLNGIESGTQDFTEIDKFARNTISREVEELNFVIAHLKNGDFGEISNNPSIGLLGHSRGGGVSILAAAQNEDVNAVATWAAVSDFDRYSDRQKKQWHDIGYFEVKNSRTGQVMRMNESYLEDIEKHAKEKLGVLKAVANLKKPLFLAHGEQDLAVPAAECETIFNNADKDIAEKMIIPSTGHTFDIKHPFEGSNAKFDSLLNKTSEFFKIYLG